MAEMLVDSTKIDACLDAEADAIRAKTGGSADIPFDFANNKGFADAIAAIPNRYEAADEGKVVSNGALVSQTAHAKVTTNGVIDTTLNNSVEVDVPVTPDYHSSKIGFNVSGATLDSADIVYDFGNYDVDLRDFLYNTYLFQTSGSKIEIKCGKITSLYRAGGIRSGYALDTLRLTQSLTPYISTSISTSEFTRGSKIAHIVGTYFELSSPGTNVYRFFHNPNLIEVYMVPNRITTGFKMSTGALIDASIVSICNALTAASGQTITVDNAATKAKLSTIVGTVAQLSTNPVTGATETFDFFTQDAGGSTTLLDFITNTKGWTVA